MTDRLIDFGDNNPDQWDREPRPDQLALPIEFPDREHRTVPRSLAVTRRRPIKRVETKEDLL